MKKPTARPSFADERDGMHAATRSAIRDQLAAQLYVLSLHAEDAADADDGDHAREAVRSATVLANALYPRPGA